MVDWAYVNGMAEEYGMGDPDMDHHDPAGHCGGGAFPVNHRRGRSAYGPPLKCRNCGSTEVHWQAVKGRHEMYDKATLTRHECQVKDTEGFDDVV